MKGRSSKFELEVEEERVCEARGCEIAQRMSIVRTHWPVSRSH